ncbi:MAG: hypothetical protein PHO34_00800 [Candidatus Omnitrophica bacterium]|nr:hypothetical protein [Candidatus Omnitrophota bacterium]MDD5042171.1 hypothetical protein [Candidatus Omnitrophota bacterium]MDD5500200.1 hypothetical protein [Candidatus Omnitrophota bacterium]
MSGFRKQCLNCKFGPGCRSSAVSWFFLCVGLIATVSIRLVNIVLPLGMFWPKLFWYIGICGFFLYFLYKFRQDALLRRDLEKYRIHEKISGGGCLEDEEREFLRMMICRLRSSKDFVNYFVIFSSSAVVIILAVYQDFIKR